MTQPSDVQKVIDEILRLARESVKAQRKTYMDSPNHYRIVQICNKHPNDVAVQEAAAIAINFIKNAAVTDEEGKLMKSRILVGKTGQIVSEQLFTCKYQCNPNDQFFQDFKISRPCEACAELFEISENAKSNQKTHCEKCCVDLEMEELLKRQEKERKALQAKLQKAKETK